eukprot:gene9826-9984_t
MTIDIYDYLHDALSQYSSSEVNRPGYFYNGPSTAGSSPTATLCPDNTYSPGLAKQRSCQRCPGGLAIEDNSGIRTHSGFCVAPPGYFVSGGTAVPCPVGQYKEGYNMELKCRIYFLAFKQIMAGNAGAAAAANKVKSFGSGKFTFWADPTADQLDGYSTDTSATSSAACLDSCTLDPTCYAVLIKRHIAGHEFLSCGYIKPAFTEAAVLVRTLIRAIPERLPPAAATAD